MSTDWRVDIRRIHETVVKAWKPWSFEDKRFLALALAGEVGELANLIKKEWRGDVRSNASAMGFSLALMGELADIRIYLELVAMSWDVDLDEAVQAKLPELYRRWPEGRPKVGREQP